MWDFPLLRGMNPDRATAKQMREKFWTLPPHLYYRKTKVRKILNNTQEFVIGGRKRWTPWIRPKFVGSAPCMLDYRSTVPALFLN